MSLLPRTSRPVPLPFVIALLGTFILFVGPGEWIVLGRLRKRRWTWLTFPLCAAVFSLAAVRAAEHFLGRTNRQSALIVTDIDGDGRVLRQNKFTLHFPGKSTTTISEVRQGIEVSCASEMGGRGVSTTETVPLYQGTIPSQFSMKQTLKQWSPHLQRTLTFGGSAVLPTIDWGQISARSLSVEGMVPVQRWVDQLDQQGWNVQFLNGSKSAWMRPSKRVEPSSQQITESLSRIREGDHANWAATISPSGSADLSDLPVLDPTNPREWLVVATRTSQQTLHMVRRIYRDE